LLQFDQSITNEEDDDLEQLNPDVEVLQFSENTAIANKIIEDVSSAPIRTKKGGEVLPQIGCVSTDRSDLQDRRVTDSNF
jgi:hypothetical protein